MWRILIVRAQSLAPPRYVASDDVLPSSPAQPHPTRTLKPDMQFSDCLDYIIPHSNMFLFLVCAPPDWRDVISITPVVPNFMQVNALSSHPIILQWRMWRAQCTGPGAEANCGAVRSGLAMLCINLDMVNLEITRLASRVIISFIKSLQLSLQPFLIFFS
jgi:hypothetical protein